MVRSESGFAEEDCIFVTDFPSEGEDVWVVSVYRPTHDDGRVLLDIIVMAPPGVLEIRRLRQSTSRVVICGLHSGE